MARKVQLTRGECESRREKFIRVLGGWGDHLNIQAKGPMWSKGGGTSSWPRNWGAQQGPWVLRPVWGGPKSLSSLGMCVPIQISFLVVYWQWQFSYGLWVGKCCVSRTLAQVLASYLSSPDQAIAPVLAAVWGPPGALVTV